MRNVHSSGERRIDTTNHVHSNIAQKVIDLTSRMRDFFVHLARTKDPRTQSTASAGNIPNSSRTVDLSLDPVTECSISKKLFWNWLTEEKIKEHQGKWVIFTKAGLLGSMATNREAREYAQTEGFTIDQYFSYKIDADWIEAVYTAFPERRKK